MLSLPLPSTNGTLVGDKSFSDLDKSLSTYNFVKPIHVDLALDSF
jgi:hypothetical protein